MTAPARLAAAPARPSAPSTPRTPRPRPGEDRPQLGFVLWVGIDPQDRSRGTAEIVELAETLGELARDLVPSAETYTALSLGEAAATGHRPVELDGLGDRLAHLETTDRARRAG